MSEINQGRVLKKGIQSVLYIFGSQILTLLLGFVTAFFIPKILNVAGYGYWNIYLFYAGYTGLFQLGLVDGIYLKYGNFEYKDLPFEIFRRVFDILLIFLFLVTGLLLGAIFLFEKDPGKIYMYAMAAMNVSIGVFGIFVMVSQVTNRFKQYSLMTVVGKALLVASILILNFTNTFGFRALSIIDFVVKVLILLIMMVLFKELVFGKRATWREGLNESIDNIRVGISLMIANVLGMLLLGLGRFIIEQFQSVSNFGQYSFAINTTNLVMMFISSISLVIYPILKRLNKDKLAESYRSINSLLMILVFFLLLTYYPLQWLVEHYYAKYLPILNYLYIFYPIIIYQSKIQMLVNSFFKTLRKERALMVSNFLAVALFGIVGFTSYYYFQNIESIVWCTVLVVACWCYGSEIYITRIMNMRILRLPLLLEILVPIVFMVSVGLIGGLSGLIVYIVTFIIYFSLHAKSIIGNGKALLGVVFNKKV
jgi:O-antigen/teichoic acid export membrane protein